VLWNKFKNFFRKEKYIYFDAYPTPQFTSRELSTETKSRIEKLDKRLEEAGTKHLHFSWNYEELAKGNKSLDDVANSMCQLMEDLLDGKCEVVDEKDWDIAPIPEHIEEIISKVTL